MNKFYKLLFITLMLCATNLMLAQRFTISGVVKDASTGEKLVGANVLIPSLSTGAATNTDGAYKIENVPGGTYELKVSYIGYNSITKNVKVAGDLKLDLTLDASSVLLNETVVKSTKAVLRETPVAFSEVKAADIEAKIGSQDLPMVLNTTPSVYSSPVGGGAGDANLVMRGFDQKNIAVMINGVPVNDMEGKTVYWSNWAGVADVSDNIQLQRGLGASPYSINAVGGVINVQTAGVGSAEEYVKFRSEAGSNGLTKNSLSFHQKVAGDFSVTGLVSRRTGDGYAIGTYDKMWTYYFAAGTVIGNHSFELQAIGSPQEHGQRTSRQTYDTWDGNASKGIVARGRLFNASVGRLNGANYNDAINKYDKPAINFNWNWQVNNNSSLSTIVYYSHGAGWGSRVVGTPSVIASGPYAGYKDYDKVFLQNSTRFNKTYDALNTQSTIINGVAYNNHYWSGLLSTFKTVLSPTMTLTAGIDGRYYIGEHYTEVRDLLGGDYYADVYKNGTGGDINNPTHLAKVGEKYGYYYEGHVRQLGGFAQVEYKAGKISSFLNVSAAQTGYQREDFFNYTPNDPLRKSDWVGYTGFTAKTGLNYNLNENHSAYVNVGYFQTPPSLSNTFVGFNSTLANTLVKNRANEKIFSAELGYQFNTSNIVAKGNVFYTEWKDRAFTYTYTDPAANQSVTTSITGAQQRHMGAELELLVKLMRGLDIKGSASLIDAKYQNNPDALISTDAGTLIKEVIIYTDGLNVGAGFPRQQGSLEVLYNQYLGYGMNLNINPVYRFNGSQYAFFNPDNRQTATDTAQPFVLPDYSIVDLHVNLNFLITDASLKKISLGFHVYNLLNYADYVVDGTDGSKHNGETSTLFYGRERWYNFSVGFNF